MIRVTQRRKNICCNFSAKRATCFDAFRIDERSKRIGWLSLSVNKDFVNLLFFLELAFTFTNANMLLFPVLGANGVFSSLNYDALESLDSDAHLVVQLLLY